MIPSRTFCLNSAPCKKENDTNLYLKSIKFINCEIQMIKEEKITYIEPPGSLIDCRLGIDIAFKVDVITFLNFICIQSWAKC